MNKRKNEVIEIPAKSVETDQPVKRQLRVAAYCRVSTNQESQQNSYQAQKEYYTDKIASNPDWCLPSCCDGGELASRERSYPQPSQMGCQKRFS